MTNQGDIFRRKAQGVVIHKEETVRERNLKDEIWKSLEIRIGCSKCIETEQSLDLSEQKRPGTVCWP